MTHEDIRCSKCGHIITDEVPCTSIAQRKPCPKCGSLNRTVSVSGEICATLHITGSMELITYPQILLATCKGFIEDGQYSISVVVAHMACEVSVERVLSNAFKSKGLQYLADTIMDFLNGYNLAGVRNRKLYTALTGDQIEEQPFWQAFMESATRRNKIIHASSVIGQEDAQSSYQAARAFVSHLRQ
jgi:phage FluMu protein Com